ncbi:hypothetical protein [Miltoncostaea marina]|uniref:hypothetical protein n=1 Tax=Miltoncostaea marina TaxID=2843215 RepID=UPI001C3C2936|nr:hypothetical protein [Miltoncostaea marina]
MDAVESLGALRAALLRLHAEVIEHERRTYERVHGRVSAGDLLRLTISSPWFAWVRPLSELIVAIDEALGAEEPPDDAGAGALARAAAALVSAGDAPGALGRPYGTALQEAPGVVLAHAVVRRALRAWPDEGPAAPQAP